MDAHAKATLSNRARLDALVETMYADYTSGLTLAEVGRKHGNRSVCSVWSLFANRGLPRRKKLTAVSLERKGRAQRARLDEEIARMHADYMLPMTMMAVGRKYGRSSSAVRELFVTRGLYVRPFKRVERQENGSPKRYVSLTEEQLQALIERCTKIYVPAELKFEWRRWSMEQRRAFISRLRAHVASGEDAPALAYSSNVEPFEYGHPGAHAIAERINQGRDSRQTRQRIRVVSQGVIFEGQLWFWARGNDCGYALGKWAPETGRPMLHHVLWKRHHGPIPAGHVVRFADRNPNNLSPENLVLATRNDVARENQAGSLQRKSRALTALLLERAQQPNKDNHVVDLLHLRRR